jgi:hypothetical protein
MGSENQLIKKLITKTVPKLNHFISPALTAGLRER